MKGSCDISGNLGEKVMGGFRRRLNGSIAEDYCKYSMLSTCCIFREITEFVKP